MLEVPPGYTSTGEVGRRMLRALVQRHAAALALTGADALMLLVALAARLVRRASDKRTGTA